MAGELRHRRKGKKKSDKSQTSTDENFDKYAVTTSDDVLTLVRFCVFLVGFAVMVGCGYLFANYVCDLHENQLWFTNIKPVEREISLRTECGLYYSYFKEILAAPNFIRGFWDLTVDNATEHGRTVNILQRFNVYQEVALAGVYQYFDISKTMDPIVFYVYSVFGLTGFLVASLFAVSWYLSGNWLAGLLTAAFFTVNLDDSTRVFFTVNLREAFAFPFLWAQILCVCVYLERSPRRWILTDLFCSVGMLVFGFLFALQWQFNQFVFLLQAAALYALGVLQLAPTGKLLNILLLQLIALLSVWMCQFAQPMLLGSLVLSFIPAAALSLLLCHNWRISGGIVTGAFKIVIQLVLTCLLTVAMNIAVKKTLQLEADAHIYKFIKGKFGFASPRDFESRIYLCHGAFQFLENDFFIRTSRTLVFPLYVSMAAAVLFLLGKDLIMEWCAILMPPKAKFVPQDPTDRTDKEFYCNRRPNIAYLVIQSFLVGLMAMMTLRMKYLWFPHLAVLGSLLVADALPALAQVCAKQFLKVDATKVTKGLRYALPIALIAFSAWQYLPTYRQQMTDLKEFWDPDTVELMEWVKTNTAPEASFAGSMQLLAGVKACTSRHLCNHPHFEDKWLRERTKRLYQMYARRTAKEVHKILKEELADYIILEDSICLATSDGCRTPDLVDFDNGHIPDSGVMFPGLEKSDTPRFCDEIRKAGAEYTKYFSLVLENHTFRVYAIL